MSHINDRGVMLKGAELDAGRDFRARVWNEEEKRQ